MHLCFSGYYDNAGDFKEIPLTLEGVRGTSPLFSYTDSSGNVKVKSLLDIKKAVAAKKGYPKSFPSLNFNKTLHLDSNKSIHQLKNQFLKDFYSRAEEPQKKSTEAPKQLDFLDTLAGEAAPSADFDEKILHLPASVPKQNNSLSDYKEEFCTYLESQVAAVENITHLSDEDKLKLCKVNLMSLLSM